MLPPPPRSPLHTTKKRTISPSSLHTFKKKVKKDVLIKKWIQEHHWGNISQWNITNKTNKTNYVQEITNIFKDSNLSEFQKQNIFECILLTNSGQLRRNNYLRESLCKTNIVSHLIRLNWTLIKWNITLQQILNITEDVVTCGSIPPIFVAINTKNMSALNLLLNSNFLKQLKLTDNYDRSIFEVAIQQNVIIFIEIFKTYERTMDNINRPLDPYALLKPLSMMGFSCLFYAIHFNCIEIINYIFQWTRLKLKLNVTTKIPVGCGTIRRHIRLQNNFLTMAIQRGDESIVSLILNEIDWPKIYIQYAIFSSFRMCNNGNVILFLYKQDIPFVQKWLFCTNAIRVIERNNTMNIQDITEKLAIRGFINNRLSLIFYVISRTNINNGEGLLRYILHNVDDGLISNWVPNNYEREINSIHGPISANRQLFDETLFLRGLFGNIQPAYALFTNFIRCIRMFNNINIHIPNGSAPMSEYCRIYTRIYTNYVRFGITHNFERAILLWLWKLYCNAHGKKIIALPLNTDLHTTFFHLCGQEGAAIELLLKNSKKNILKF